MELLVLIPTQASTMKSMNEAPPMASTGQSQSAQALTDAIGAKGSGLADGLLAMLERTQALVCVKEVATGAYVYANRPMAEFFGKSPAELVGARDAELMEPAQASAIRASEQAALAYAAPTSGEHRIEHEGKRREFSVDRIGIARADGTPPHHVLSVWVEKTAAHQRELHLQRALIQLEQQHVAAELERRENQDQVRDAATGLYQHLHFDDQLRREVDLSSREHREFALVSIAIDPFDAAVAALGPQAPVRILESLGRLLRGNTRAMDASCRLDENRFAILLSGVGLATAHSRMEGLRRQCATQIVVLDGRDIGFTVSMGVASFPHTAHTEADLMQATAGALDEAQKRGGNHVALASIQFDSGAA